MTMRLTTLALSVGVLGCSGAIDDPRTEQPEGPRAPADRPAMTIAGPAAPGVGGPPPSGVAPPESAPPAPCTPAPLAPARLWVLSETQYANAVNDLLAVKLTDVSAQVAGAPTAVSDSATIGGQAVFRYGETAATAARAAVAKLDGLVTCTTRDEKCAEAFVRARVPRAFRRPVADVEVADLMGIYRAGAVDGFAVGVRLVIEAVLQSPSFLYRSELGASGALTPHELAASVAFLLLDGLPDEPLWGAAADGSLVQAAVLERQVDRLLALPRVRQNLSRVAHGWLAVGRVDGVVRDAKTVGQFPAALQRSLAASAARSVDEVLWSGRFPDLFSFRRLFVDAAMARTYGVAPPAGTELVAVDFPDGERGGGILTHPAVMAGIAKPDDTDVVRRGLFVHHNLLCGADVPPPPPELGAQIASSADLPTERARAEQRSKNALCSGCHASFDPYGVALEHYDPIGRYRTTLAGRPVDASVVLTGAGPELDGPVANGVELARKVGRSGRLWGCAVQQVAYQAFGRATTAEGERCSLRPVEAAFARSGAFADLVKALVLSPAFARRST